MKRSLTNNVIYNMMFQFLTTFLPVITTPYLARTLGVSQSGVYSYVETIVTLATVFGAIGTTLYGCRKIAYVRDDKEALTKTTYEIILLKLILLLPLFIIYSLLFCVSGEFSIYFIINIITVISSAIEITWFFNGIEDFKSVTIKNIIIKLLFVVCLFLFIKTPNDLWKYIVLVSVSGFLGNISMWFCLPRYINSFKGLKDVKPLRHLKESFILFIPQSANYIYSLSDKAMLGFLTPTLDNVGIYDYAYRIVKMIISVLQSIGYVILSRISNLSANNDKDGIKTYINKSIRFSLFLGFPMMFGLIGISNSFVPFYLGSEFIETSKVILCISPLIIITSFNSILGVQLLLAIKKDKQYTVATIIGAVTNIVLNFALIPILGIYGACITSLISEIIVMIIQLYYCKEYVILKNIIIENKNVIICTIIMFIICKSLEFLSLSYLYMLVLQIGISIIIYVGLMFVLRDYMLIQVINKVFEILKIKYRIKD